MGSCNFPVILLHLLEQKRVEHRPPLNPTALKIALFLDSVSPTARGIRGALDHRDATGEPQSR